MKKTVIFSFLLSLSLLAGCSAPASPEQSSEETPKEALQETPAPPEILSPEKLEEIKADESGEVMVLMYHNIGEEEATWTRTPDNFRRDLQTLYDKGFRCISLEDYVKGNITTKAGFTPVVLTFDDGRENNFRYITENGNKVIDPSCAVAIMEEFKAAHPDFDMTASFFLNGLAFGQKDEEKEKIDFLINNGYSIGNHTMSHPSLRKLDAQEIQKEIASLKARFETLCPNADINTLALPFGEKPKGDDFVLTYKGQHEDTAYENIAVLLVGWDPYLSPYDVDFDFANIHRVRASETNVENVGLYNWLEAYDKGSKPRFISDGNPSVVSVPSAKAEKIDPEKLSGRELITY